MAEIIPKRIFYVWIGPTIPKKVSPCIESWQKVMPDYEVIELNNYSSYFDFTGELNRCLWFRAVYERKLWAYVSDYIRVKALLDHGGIYFDTDITVLRRFDAFLQHAFFSGFESRDLICLAVFGCVPRHPLLEDIYEFYQKKIWHSPLYTIPEIATYLMRKKYKCILYDSRRHSVQTQFESVTLYPEKYFFPYRWNEKYTDTCITSDTYAIHLWGASWVKPEIMDWLATKHLPSTLNESTIGTDIHEVQRNTGRKLKLELLLFNCWSVLKAYKQANTVYVELFGGIPLLTILYEKQSAMWYLFNRFHLYTWKYH
jgi:mannosyltransferase OCH1-like enzyme